MYSNNNSKFYFNVINQEGWELNTAQNFLINDNFIN